MDHTSAGEPPLITLHFDGTVGLRTGDYSTFKGRLFSAYAGDVVYSKIDVRNGAIGVIPPEMPAVAVSSEYPVYVVNEQIALSSYIKLLFRSRHFRGAINSLISGASGRKRVQPDQIEALEVPLPPLSVQRAIVERWTKAQREMIAARQQLDTIERQISLEIYARLGVPTQAPTVNEFKYAAVEWKELNRWSVGYFRGTREGLLGFTQSRYPIVALKSCLVETMNGYCIRPVPGPTNHKMLKLNALTPGGVELNAGKFVKVTDQIARRFSLCKDDLLVCRSVGSYDHIAKCAVVKEDRPDVLFPDIMIRARFNETILPEYAREVIQTPLGRSFFQSNARTTVGMWKIGAEDIREFPVPLPPVAVQRTIIRIVKEKRDSIASEREKIDQRGASIAQEIEEMILGIRPRPDTGN